MSRPSVAIVSPAVAASNNGNWQTASRWQELLAPALDVRIASHWPDAQAKGDDVLLALHARRSADSIQAWAGSHGQRGLAVVLTGTDLYRDIAFDPQAQRSLELAARLVVLQELGIEALPPRLRGKARVIYQSTPAQEPAPKADTLLQAVMVGHLREVKSPRTLFEAARLLAGRDDIRIDHIGEALEPALGEEALATQRDCPNYRWLGGLPHGETRERIRRAHLLVHPSAMEGGANVIMEAVCSGTPVLASRVPGNVGMLGAAYDGYFAHGDAAGLADLLRRCRQGQQAPGAALLPRLGAQCALRAPLFAPEAERAALLRLVAELMESTP
ncbi:selenoneine biosynthesis selenosugar synthase SenB [Caenimonas terrae]|uniref:Selenoneine biosynthesis selenosugar synthase SenB n=1 Tax=Caenimonas terrae TaxID=696074 RepID=A0ABW0NAM2_9BURK